MTMRQPRTRRAKRAPQRQRLRIELEGQVHAWLMRKSRRDAVAPTWLASQIIRGAMLEDMAVGLTWEKKR